MKGIHATSGGTASDLTHLRQSVRDILTTPIGSRVMRRDYGSRLFELIDAPFTASLRVALVAAAIEALLAWEPRLEIDEVKLTSYAPGAAVFEVSGVYVPTGNDVVLSGVMITGGVA